MYTNTIDKAIALAAECHAGQVRKGRIEGHPIPYIVHPLEVMKTAWRWGAGTPEVLAAAVLHDTLEDTRLTEPELRAAFGDPVAQIVVALTKSWAISGKAYLARCADAEPPVLVVKLADCYCNTNDFFLTNRGYARKFFAKARVLLDALDRRDTEVAGAYGTATIEAITADYARLDATLHDRS